MMKTFDFNFPCWLLAMLLWGLWVGAASAATSGSQVRHLEQRLYALPVGGVSGDRVERLVLRLVRLQPRRAVRFYQAGRARLSNAGGGANASATKMALDVERALKRSGLSEGLVAKISRRVFQSSFGPAPGLPANPSG